MNILSIDNDYNLTKKIKIDHIIKKLYFQVEDNHGIYNWIKKISPEKKLTLTCIKNDEEIFSMNFINPKLIKHKYIANEEGNFRLGVVQYGKEELTELPVKEELERSQYEVITNRCFLIPEIKQPTMSDFEILTQILKYTENEAKIWIVNKKKEINERKISKSGLE